jgi:hypothetical protein
MYKDINVKFLLELHNTVNFCLDCLFVLFLRDPGKIRKGADFSEDCPKEFRCTYFRNKFR